MTFAQRSVKFLFAFCLCLTSITAASAQAVAVKAIGTSYVQNFNSLPKYANWYDFLLGSSRTWGNEETLAGWSAQIGNSAATSIDISAGTATGGLKSLATSAEEEDRSLGGFATSTAAVSYGVRLQNATGKSVTQIEVSFDLQQWYDGSAVSSLALEYRVIDKAGKIGAWVPVSTLRAHVLGNNNKSLNGNLHVVAIQQALGGLVLAPGDELTIRWSEAAGRGKDLLAIDNFRLTTEEVKATPATKVFYSNAWIGGELSQLSAWNTDRLLGFGESPASFSAPNQVFIVQPSLFGQPVLSKDLLLHSSSRLVFGTGTPLVFTIPENVTITAGSLDISALAQVTIASDAIPTFGLVDQSSTVVYNALGTLSVKVATYGNLLIDGSSGKVKKLSQKIVVHGQLELRNGGKLEAGDFDIVIKDSQKPVKYDENSFVVLNGKGRLKTKLAPGDSAVFPVGLKKALPVKLKLKAGSVADTFSVKVIEGLYTAYENNAATGLPIDSKVVGKTWIVDEHTPGGSNLEMTLEWKAEDMSADFTADSAYLGHYHNGQWDKGTAAPIIRKGNIYSVTRQAITSFSPFGVAAVNSAMGTSNPNPLPVELVYFQAKRLNHEIKFEWETASEKDNDFFTLEQSFDGKNFQEVGQPVRGAGTSAVKLKYAYLLPDQTAKVVYYRLKQTDYDGAFEYSKTIAVKASTEQVKIATTLFPNPSQDGKVQLISSQASEAVSLTVFGNNGTVILQQEVMLGQGLPFDLDLSGQAPGLYLLQLQNSTSKETLRLIKR